MSAYYNEFNPYAAQWLRNLIDAGLIAPGVVDERSIEDVTPEDLRGFTQVHLFAGVGGWSLALRSAGVPDDYPVWSASTPCQPFSAAGAGAGFADERHLWPIVEHLARECRPTVIVGEQVASRDAEPWLDLVQDDMEALGYAFGAVAFPSAGIGAPHIRDRTYWVADANSERRGGGQGASPWGVDDGADARRVEGDHGLVSSNKAGLGGLADAQLQQRQGGQRAIRSVDETRGRQQSAAAVAGLRSIGGLDNPHHQGLEGQRGGHQATQRHGQGAVRPATTAGESGGLGDTEGVRPSDGSKIPRSCGQVYGARPTQFGTRDRSIDGERPGPTNGFWSAADWLGCRDGKWRPVEPGTFPLVDGSAARVGRGRADWHAPAGKEGQGHRAGRLAGYGNAINIEAARIFIECAFGTVRPVVEDLSDLI